MTTTSVAILAQASLHDTFFCANECDCPGCDDFPGLRRVRRRHDFDRDADVHAHRGPDDHDHGGADDELRGPDDHDHGGANDHGLHGPDDHDHGRADDHDHGGADDHDHGGPDDEIRGPYDHQLRGPDGHDHGADDHDHGGPGHHERLRRRWPRRLRRRRWGLPALLLSAVSTSQ